MGAAYTEKLGHLKEDHRARPPAWPRAPQPPLKASRARRRRRRRDGVGCTPLRAAPALRAAPPPPRARRPRGAEHAARPRPPPAAPPDTRTHTCERHIKRERPLSTPPPGSLFLSAPLLVLPPSAHPPIRRFGPHLYVFGLSHTQTDSPAFSSDTLTQPERLATCFPPRVSVCKTVSGIH
eukprot:6204433-Pleurochrysis_carterae.AAC.3